jgi:hypothetical protein
MSRWCIALAFGGMLVLLGMAGAAGAGGRPAVFASQLAGIRSTAYSGLQVVNLDDTQPMTAVLDMTRQGGGTVPIYLPPIGPFSSYSTYFAVEGKLLGGLYSAVISADRRVAALALTEWPVSGAAELVNAPEATVELTLPLVLKNSFGHSSLITVQNTDPAAPHTARLRFTRTGEIGARLAVDLVLPKGESRTLDLAADPQFAALPEGFTGTMLAESREPIAVQSFLDDAGSDRAVYSFNGRSLERSSSRSFAPLFTTRGGGVRDDTLIALANPWPEAVSATITVRGSGGSCAGQTFTVRTGSIQPGSNALIYRWPALANGPLADLAGIPPGCVGAATIKSAPHGVLAVVAYLSASGSAAGGYNAFTSDEGAKVILLPLYRNQQGPRRMTTSFQIMNLGALPARAELSMENRTTATFPCPSPYCHEFSVAPGEAYTFSPTSDGRFPVGPDGSAEIDSDQPLVVVAVDESLVGAQDRSVYRGIPNGPPPAPPAGMPTPLPRPEHVPLLVHDADLRGPLRPTPDAVAATPAVPPRVPYRIYLWAVK